MDLEQTLTSRDQINGQLRGVLDEATGRWGIRVNRVELKAIDPPASVQGSMEQQMRAERDRRAAILTAEGVKQSQILTAEGEKQAAILRAEGQAQSAILQAQGESRAILQVFDAIHRGKPDSKLLAYQYLQMLPELANGTSDKLWVIPTEFTAALGTIARGFGGSPGGSGPSDDDDSGPTPEVDFGPGGPMMASGLAETSLQDPDEALAQARSEAQRATSEATAAGKRSGSPFSRSAERGQRPAESERRDAGRTRPRDESRFAPPAGTVPGQEFPPPPPSANQPGPTAGPPSTAVPPAPDTPPAPDAPPPARPEGDEERPGQ